MKERYETPETKLEEFEAVDILTASFNDVLPDDNDVPFGS